MKQDHVNEMLRDLKRIGETRTPDMAERCLKVPRQFYIEEKYAEREREMMLKTPLALAHFSQIENACDYLVVDTVGKSILLTRDDDGEAHAFLNTCRHRGHEPAQGCGNKKRFSCPYHSWTYDIKGQLIGMPMRERYEGVDLGQLGLTELPSEERHGFIWVVLTPGLSINVSEHLGPLDEELAGWDYDKAKCMNLSIDEVESNWKSTGEGFLETLHLPTIHKSTFTPMISKHVDLVYTQQRGKHVCYMPVTMEPAEYEALGDTDSLIDVSEPGWQSKFVKYGALGYWIFPNLFLGNHPVNEGISFTIYQPGATPDTTITRFHYLVRKEFAEDPANSELLDSVVAVMKKAFLEEDGPALSSCGRGIRTGIEEIVMGRNELALQLVTRVLAKETGCPLSEF